MHNVEHTFSIVSAASVLQRNWIWQCEMRNKTEVLKFENKQAWFEILQQLISCFSSWNWRCWNVVILKVKPYDSSRAVTVLFQAIRIMHFFSRLSYSNCWQSHYIPLLSILFLNSLSGRDTYLRRSEAFLCYNKKNVIGLLEIKRELVLIHLRLSGFTDIKFKYRGQ